MTIAQPKAGEPIRLIETKKGPRYRVVLDVAPPGSPRRQTTRTFDRLPEARKFVSTTRAGLATGTYLPPSGETVEQLCRRWLDSRRDIRPVTVEGYRNWLAPVLRRLGGRRVQSLTIADMDALVAWLSTEGGTRGQPLGPTSVKSALVALGQALDLAIREGTLTQNVTKHAKRPRARKRVGTDLQHWQPEELLRFKTHADTDPLAAAWRLTLSGMTRADVLGLRWSDVDTDAGVVRVSQGRVALDRGDLVDDPKSQARRREIPVETMHPGTTALLRSLNASQAKHKLAAGPAYQHTGFVVVDELGTPVRPEWYSDRFRALCREAGVPTITLHSVRHSLAFWLHHREVRPADAAALLGHTVEVHLSTYLPHSGASGILNAAMALRDASGAGS